MQRRRAFAVTPATVDNLSWAGAGQGGALSINKGQADSVSEAVSVTASIPANARNEIERLKAVGGVCGVRRGRSSC